ncbi:MAG: hypothetical protein A2Y25_01605 [Candidatus Melainabacteria bacterium GWF2_37_15]|nr:MAG: hypothetical protein A2Y25_01605 [Candidatus Melainabacteria bacterium GWF2_37_15]
MKNQDKYIISDKITILDALKQIDELSKIAYSPLCLFVIDQEGKVQGSLTDGDIRRAILKGVTLEDNIKSALNKTYNFIKINSFDFNYIKMLKEREISLVPMIDEDGKIVKLIDIKNHKSILPLDAVIMAGGLGTRLRPFTENIPKPLLKLGDKTLIEYNIDWLNEFGIMNFYITVNYLGDQIIEHLGDGKTKEIKINYVKEDKPMGTAGSISLINNFENEDILVLNSDIITNIDYHDFYQSFLEEEAMMTIASIHYTRNVPYAVFETDCRKILSYKEKPSYNYTSNAGIYLVKKELLKEIPENTFFNMIDLIDICLKKDYKITCHPILGYWLDVGNMEDLAKAQCDIKNIRFS